MKTFHQYYLDFLAQVNSHYNASFPPDTFDQFDLVAAPLLMSYLKETGYAQALQEFPDYCPTNEEFMQQCKRYGSVTQEELNIKEQFIVRSPRPYEEAIRLLKEITTMQTFSDVLACVNASVTAMFDEVAKQCATPMTGDDIPEVAAYVVLHACSPNFIHYVYAGYIHVDQQVIQGSLGYTLTQILNAISLIGKQFNKEYFRKSTDKSFISAVLQKRYLVPALGLYDYLVTQKANSNPDRPFIVERDEIVVSGYQAYYCPQYMLGTHSFLKTLVCKCACASSEQCNHSISCSVVSLNPEASFYQLDQLDKQLSGLRGLNVQVVNIDGSLLLTAKQGAVWQQGSQELTLIPVEPGRDLTRIQLFNHYYCIIMGCAASYPDAQQTRPGFVIARPAEQAHLKAVYNHCYGHSLGLTETLPMQCGCWAIAVVKIAMHLLGVAPEPLPSQLEPVDILEFYSQLDGNFIQVIQNAARQVRSMLALTLPFDVQKSLWGETRQLAEEHSVLKRHRDKRRPAEGQAEASRRSLTENEQIRALLEGCEFQGPGSIPAPQEFAVPEGVMTPFCLQTALRVLHFLVFCLQKTQGQALHAVELFTLEGLYELTEAVKQFQREKSLQPTGFFSLITAEQLGIETLRIFYRENLVAKQRPPHIKEIYGYE